MRKQFEKAFWLGAGLVKLLIVKFEVRIFYFSRDNFLFPIELDPMGAGFYSFRIKPFTLDAFYGLPILKQITKSLIKHVKASTVQPSNQAIHKLFNFS